MTEYVKIDPDQVSLTAAQRIAEILAGDGPESQKIAAAQCEVRAVFDLARSGHAPVAAVPE